MFGLLFIAFVVIVCLLIAIRYYVAGEFSLKKRSEAIVELESPLL